MQGAGSRERSARVPAASGAVATIGAIAGLVAVAYAAVPDGMSGTVDALRKPASAPAWRPTISRHPEKVAVSDVARFDFGAGRRARRFSCRLDRRRWKACRAPIAYGVPAPGWHSFAVRAFDRWGRRSAATRFRWRVLEPKDFAIVPRLSGIGALYPGAPAVTLPVTIDNPNPVPIHVTSLRVTATADPPGCARAENLLLAPAGLSSEAPLRVPAGGSASLPAPGTSPPEIQLRDLPVNQDACQNARFPLAFSGEARG
jgi:hypothetical protein